jgi:hypothetical protein
MNRCTFVFTTSMVFGVLLGLTSTDFCSGQNVASPLLGIAHFSDGTLRRVYGVPGNIVVDTQSLGWFQAASFSNQCGLVFKDSHLQLLTRDMRVLADVATAGSEAVLNTTSCGSAVAWLPAVGELVRWNGSSFSTIPVRGLDPQLAASAVRIISDTAAELLLQDRDGWLLQAKISSASGDVISLVPIAGIRGAAFWAEDKLIVQSTSGVGLVDDNGSTRMLIPNAEHVRFQTIASQWLLITSKDSRQSWLVNLRMHDISVSEVPVIASLSREAGQ